MQITLLPPLLPTEGVTAVTSSSLAFAPGMKIVATVLNTTPESGTLLSLFGRQMPAGEALPYRPGTKLRLEVVTGGSQPVLRLLAAGSPDPSATSSEPETAAAAPPVSTLRYGLAAAVFAAREGPDVRSATAALARWIPAVVTRGLITEAQGAALMRDLLPLRVPVGTSRPSDSPPATATLAAQLAERVAAGGLLLERRLAEAVRQDRPESLQVAMHDLRARLAVLAGSIPAAGPELQPVRAAIADVQEALLVEQARSAAHLARDGVVDVRIPLQAETQEAEVRLRLRVEKDAEDRAGGGAAPWRQMTLDLALEGLGRVHVRLAVAGTDVQAEFVAERADAADAIERRLVDLERALEAAGFGRVLSRVVVDPVRASTPDDLPPLPPQHSIVDARA